MAEVDGGESSRPLTDAERIAYWWHQFRTGERPRLCLLGWHAWGPWDARPTTGFNIAWRLVPGTEFFRICRRCRRHQSYARARLYE